MTTLIENLSSDSNTNFISTPNVLTMDSDNNTTKLASTEFVQNTIAGTIVNKLDTESNQSISATTITPEITITNVDTASAGTLQLGLATDSSIQIGVSSSITMLGYIQPFNTSFKYLTTGCTNTTALLGTAHDIQKIYTGSEAMTTGSATINFVPPFGSPPIIVLGVTANNASDAMAYKWIQSPINNSTAKIRCSTSSANIKINWIAVGK